ncbi:MAG TPA: ABC transporter permease [Bellilinea sp.]|nr:ABC transporter permease [Bellilinea sp.]
MNQAMGLIHGMIASATPILLAALGGALTFYAGIFNIAMEGMMLGGAFFGMLGSYYFQSWELGIVCAILGAIAMALIFILFAVVLKMDEFITGVGLNLFTVGLTTYMLRQIFKVKGAFSSPQIESIPNIRLPFLEGIPVIGDLLSNHNLIVYITVVAVFVVSYLVFKTRFGLRLRAAGYNRACLDTSGVSANKIRIISLILCGVLCGIAGAYLSLGYVTLFSEGMSAGRGWISLAAIILVSGNPWGVAFVSLLFGFMDGLGLFLQRSMPSQFTSMVPYAAVLVALFIYSMRLKKKKIT